MTRHHTYVFGKELHTRRGQFFCWEKVVLLQFVMTWKLNQAFLIEFPPLSARYIEESILGNNHRLGCSFLIRLLYPDYSWHPEGKVGFIHTSQYLTKQKRKSAFFITSIDASHSRCIDESAQLHQATVGCSHCFIYGHGWLGNYCSIGLAIHADYAWYILLFSAVIFMQICEQNKEAQIFLARQFQWKCKSFLCQRLIMQNNRKGEIRGTARVFCKFKLFFWRGYMFPRTICQPQ